MFSARENVIKNEKSLAEKIPFLCVVAPGIVECKGGELCSTLRLRGAYFESVEDILLDDAAAKLNNFYKAIASDEISFQVHRVRRLIHDRLSSFEGPQFVSDFIEQYNEGFNNKPLMATELYVTLIMRKASAIRFDPKKREEIKKEAQERIEECELPQSYDSGFFGAHPKF